MDKVSNISPALVKSVRSWDTGTGSVYGGMKEIDGLCSEISGQSEAQEVETPDKGLKG